MMQLAMVSGNRLFEFLKQAAVDGQLKRTTESSMRSACSQVLGAVYGQSMAVDLETLDVEDTLDQFERGKGRELGATTLESYKARFRQSMRLFRVYLRDPAAWKLAVRRHAIGEGNGGPTAMGDSSMPSRLSEYAFPLREGGVARLVLPVGIKASDARRLTAFINTLVVDIDQND